MMANYEKLVRAAIAVDKTCREHDALVEAATNGETPPGTDLMSVLLAAAARRNQAAVEYRAALMDSMLDLGL